MYIDMGKKHRYIARRICCVFMVFWIVTLTGCRSEVASSNKVGGYVHFSIDDATQIFQEITLKECKSIFEQPTLKRLHKLHTTYGLKCTLYLYENIGGYNIAQMPDCYRKEFVENSDWLKLAFHGYNESNPEEDKFVRQQFKDSFKRVCAEIKRFAGEESLSQTLRLHYWYATEEMVSFLKENGVQAVLCPDNETLGYNLTEEESNLLNRSQNGILEGDLLYYKTDIRYESFEEVEKVFTQREGDQIIVVFTHAWCFDENISKIEDSMEWFTDNGYQFTFLENQEGIDGLK